MLPTNEETTAGIGAAQILTRETEGHTRTDISPVPVLYTFFVLYTAESLFPSNSQTVIPLSDFFFPP